ncbi:hypothetical protein L2E82_10397 [Cichorium intybus]|uniref:Uncharacterized protein n=1 Tax=Cichorium intybus TaxID=13427 RepID=A0ACB9GBM2_CICIN|nr:hypothetical protein L2E82_10397 [Cichorium intybus]
MSGHLAVPREPSLPAFRMSRIPRKPTAFTTKKRVTGREAAQGLKESRELEHGRLNLVIGNRRTSPVTKIGVYRLVLSSGVSLDLHNCCYSPDMAKNIISFHALFKQGFYYDFNKLNGSISVFKNDVFIFNALPFDGVYESIVYVDNYGKGVLTIDSSSGVEKACLWHCCLGHINKKRIAQLQKDGVLESFDLKSYDVCESCLLGKVTKSPFKGSFERGEGLLDIIHTDVCGPFRTTTKDGTQFYVTFTDDFSRYGYIYLIKHKSDIFEKFKEFKNEVENQLGRKIKMLRSDRGGEYLSIEFLDYLKECGIVSQLSPPRTPQLNGVAERRNRTLLDMVRSMMNRASLPIHFWGYALETAAHILNLETPDETTLGEPSHQHEEEGPVGPTDISLPLRRSGRVSMPPEFYGFHITTDGDTFVSDRILTNLDEPANYREAVAVPESATWKEAMDSEIKSMYDVTSVFWA